MSNCLELAQDVCAQLMAHCALTLQDQDSRSPTWDDHMLITNALVSDVIQQQMLEG
jgi:hypothetical protein